MDTTNEQVQAARAHLWACEHARHDERERALFWEGGTRWVGTLKQLREAEHERDWHFAHQIAEARLGSDTQMRLEQRWHVLLEEDRGWYAQLLTELERPMPPLRRREQAARDNELIAHQRLLVQQEQERAMVAHQLGIDMLERRRALHGSIKKGLWKAEWTALMHAFDGQLASYNSAMPQALWERWRTWCATLTATQEATMASWNNRSNVDRTSLYDAMAEVSRLERLLNPVQTPPRSLAPILVAVVIVVLVALAVLTLLPQAPSHPQPPAITGTALPVPTGGIQGFATPQGSVDQATLNREGVALLRQGHCEEAIRRFSEAYEADPATPEAYEPLSNMAFCLFDLGRVDEALARWEQALALNPNSPDANAGYGMGLLAQGQEQKARIAYARAVSIKAEYQDEAFLRGSVFWSEHAIAASRGLRTGSP